MSPVGVPGENPDDDWRAESDRTGEMLVFCPDCTG